MVEARGPSVLLVRVHGLEGVAIAVAVAGLLFRGILQLGYGCRFVNVSTWRYVQSVFLPILLWSVPAFLITALYRATNSTITAAYLTEPFKALPCAHIISAAGFCPVGHTSNTKRRNVVDVRRFAFCRGVYFFPMTFS